eukprot:GFUD01010241.1.p1 GENE.GFUD01010241.1~~GFUD01010241.1.p1  ORF type:complete len:169 (+),score=43.66 GFUD01010241.1:49-555(+)
MDSLREQVMINQFVQVTGTTRDQAVSVLSSSQWQLQSALSTYLEEAMPASNKPQGSSFTFITPANTPATPPNFTDTLSLFSTLSTSGSKFTFSPRRSLSPRQTFSPPSQPPQDSQEDARQAGHIFLVPQLPGVRTRHDSEVQGGGGGGGERSTPRRGPAGPPVCLSCL